MTSFISNATIKHAHLAIKPTKQFLIMVIFQTINALSVMVVACNVWVLRTALFANQNIHYFAKMVPA